MNKIIFYKNWKITLIKSDVQKGVWFGKALNYKNENRETALGRTKKSVFLRLKKKIRDNY